MFPATIGVISTSSPPVVVQGISSTTSYGGSDIGTTRVSEVLAERIGTEPDNGSRLSCFAEVVASFGDKPYVEFRGPTFGTAGTNFWWYGFCIAGSEQTSGDMGQTVGEFGLSRGGGSYVSGSFNGSGGTSYLPVDIIGLAVDRSVSGTISIDAYKNNSLFNSYSYSLADGNDIRFGVTMGQPPNVGAQANIFTAASNQTYSAPAGFSPLE